MGVAFQLVPKMTHLPIDSGQILAVRRSRSDNMVSLPGCRTQVTSAILCLYRDPSRGTGMVMALHLKEEDRLVFYRYPFSSSPVETLLGEGAAFAESMGFQLDDTGYGRLSEAQKNRYWLELPLNKGGKPLSSSDNYSVGDSESQSPGAEATHMLQARKQQLIENVGRQLASL